MNLSIQEPAPFAQPPVSQITASQAASVGRGIGYVVLSGVLFFSLFFMLIGGVFGSALFTQKSYTAKANATVLTYTASTTTSPGSSNGNGGYTPPQTTTNCNIHYNFVVSGKTYNGDTQKSTNGVSSDCGYSKGSLISVNYDPSDPSKNAGSGKAGAIVGLVFFAIGLVMFTASLVGIIKVRRTNKSHRTATSAQIELIKSGFQELGDFWEPHHLTEAEADATITDINQRLEMQRRQVVIVNNTAGQAPQTTQTVTTQQMPPSSEKPPEPPQSGFTPSPPSSSSL